MVLRLLAPHTCAVAPPQLVWITIRMFCERQTRISREDSPGRPSSGGPISPTICGFAGFCASTIMMPAWLALLFLPSVRLPT